MQTFTRDQVKTHNRRDDGWLIIHNEVYDITSFFDDHPGGRDVLLDQLGSDATIAFDAIGHSASAMAMMSRFKIGQLAEVQPYAYYRMADLKKSRNTPDCAFIVIHNKVYDVTAFLDNHPGGRDVLLCNAGTDATQAFQDINHSAIAYKMMEQYYVGELHPTEQTQHYTISTQNSPDTEKNTQKSNRAGKSTSRKSNALIQHIKLQIQLLVSFTLVIILAAYCIQLL